MVQEALQESAAGNWADARAAFRQAHEAFPNARTARGMGMVSFELRDYVDAVRNLREALSNPVRPLTERQSIEVQALLDRSLGRVARFELSEIPEGATVTIDGRQVEAEADGTLLLPIGEHQVAVQGARLWESTIPVRGGEEEPLPMSFPMPSEEPEGPGPAPITAPPIVVQSETNFGAVALTIGGVVAFLSGVAILAAGLIDYYAVQNAPTTPPGERPVQQWGPLSGPYARTQALQGVGYGVMGLGAALTIGGAAWLGTSGDDASPGAMLRLRGAF